jgi:glycosyltransferase involved in cell wall biosynthesis
MMTAYNGFEPLVSEAAAAEIRQPARKPIMGNGTLFEAAKLNPLLMVGSVEPKKGHIPVIKCLEALWEAGYQRPLLIVGRTGWMEQDVVTAIRGSFYFNKKIFWFSDADDYDLAAAYMFCHALIFSSLAEGFGIPMIEAAYYGKPTIALDTPIVREVLGDAALLFGSAAGFAQHVLDLENSANYAAARNRAESLRWPLWENYTPQIFDRLVDFVAGTAPLPELVPPRADTPVPLRDASD